MDPTTDSPDTSTPATPPPATAAGQQLSGNTPPAISAPAQPFPNMPSTAATPTLAPQPQSKLSSFWGDIASVVGHVFSGVPLATVDQQTGAIKPATLSSKEKIENIANSMMRGAVAGIGQTGPGRYAKAAAAGAQSQISADETANKRLQEQSANVRQTQTAQQQKLLEDATRAKMSQDEAKTALDMKFKGIELDSIQQTLAEKMNDIEDREKLGHFDSLDEAHKYLGALGKDAAGQAGLDYAHGNLVTRQDPTGGFNLYRTTKEAGEQPIGDGKKINHITYDFDSKTGKVKPVITETAADPAWTNNQYDTWQGSVKTKYDAFIDEQNKQVESQAKIEHEKASTAQEKASTAKTNVETTNLKAQTPQGDVTKSGDEYLGTLPPDRGALVKSITSGHVAPERLAYLLAKKDGQQLIAEVTHYDPTFDSSKAAAYPKMYQEFTSTRPGSTGMILVNGGTALEHLQVLHHLNTSASHIRGTPAYKRYKTAVTTTSNELATFYRDNTIPGIEHIRENLDSDVPGNRNPAIKESAKLMGQRLDNYETAWKNGAPSSSYEAQMPGVSQKAKAARLELDEDYASAHPAWSISAWQKANPNGDVAAAQAEAERRDWRISP